MYVGTENHTDTHISEVPSNAEILERSGGWFVFEVSSNSQWAKGS